MPFMWSLVVSYFTIYAVNWGLNSWLPKYLTDVRGLDLLSIGWITTNSRIYYDFIDVYKWISH